MTDNVTSKSIHQLIIIGSGPAGLTAAIYAARARLEPIVLAGEQWGGQLMWTTEVENYPGFPEGIAGPELMQNMIKQAERFGAKILYKNADFVDLKSEIKVVKSGDEEFKARSVIVATGSVARKLGIPGEDTYFGRGVSTCATCDAAFYKEKVVAVVGGGDSAMEESTFLTRFAKKVYLIHRRNEFRASQIMVERAENNSKIEILFNTEVKEVVGDTVVEKIKIFNNETKQDSELELDGVFLAIGHIPVTGYLKNQVPLDESGYVLVENQSEVLTNIPGVFVAGEVQDHEYKQAITTAAAGCKAALEAQRFLEGNEEIKGTW